MTICFRDKVLAEKYRNYSAKYWTGPDKWHARGKLKTPDFAQQLPLEETTQAKALSGQLEGWLERMGAQEPALPLGALSIWEEAYPRAFFFRKPEKVYEPYEAWTKNFSRLSGIMGKILDEELKENSRAVEYFRRFKKEHPEQVALLHVNGNARDPEFEPQAFEIGVEDTLTLTFWVKNTGARAGDEVPQLYIHDRYASVAQPRQKLADFERLRLEAGESREVEFTLSPEKLKIWDINMQHVVEPGEFEVMVGPSSEAIRLRGRFRVR